MTNVFLIGFMGTGKSTVARYLSEKYGMKVSEMDQMLVEQEGRSIADIFETNGELYFREIETCLLKKLVEKQGQVISCGGGVVLRQENVDLMKKGGVIVLLTAEPETILERVKNSQERPLLSGNKNVAFIRELMEKRHSSYKHAADVIIDTDGKTVEDICDEIFTRVNK